MKGKKPTYEERKLISQAGLDTYEWLVQKNTSEIVQLVKRDDDKEIAVFDKATLGVVRYRKDKAGDTDGE